MTMPHLMNCSHSETGWCLRCVKELWESFDRLRDVAEAVKVFKHPNADGRLFRVNHLTPTEFGGTWNLEIGRVSHAGNLLPLEGMDHEEAQEFANSCEEFAHAWKEDCNPTWLMRRLCLLQSRTPCANLDGTSETEPPVCSGLPIGDRCIPCCARAWLAEFAAGPKCRNPKNGVCYCDPACND